MQDEIQERQQKEVNNFLKTKEQSASAIELTDLKVGWCLIQYGYNEHRDFVMHFTSHHERRPFPQNTDMVTKIIIGYLDQVIAPELSKDLFPSPENWDKKLITVIVREAGNKWNFDEDKVIAQFETIGNLITEQVNKAHPQKIIR